MIEYRKIKTEYQRVCNKKWQRVETCQEIVSQDYFDRFTSRGTLNFMRGFGGKEILTSNKGETRSTSISPSGTRKIVTVFTKL